MLLRAGVCERVRGTKSTAVPDMVLQCVLSLRATS